VLPLVPDLLASLRRVDDRRHTRSRPSSPGPLTQRVEPDQLGGGLRRWHVRLGEKRGDRIGPTRRGKGTKLMVLADGNGIPLASEIEAASSAEVNLIEPLIDAAVTHNVPPRLVYDRAADSNPLRKRLAQRGIELTCPHRKGRVRKATQDGRKLRRYRKRWKIERTIAWLHNFRRVVARYEVYAHLYRGFVKLACLMICLRRL